MVPALANSAVHAWAAAVAGPALIWSGWKYPGSNQAKLILIGTGIILLGTNAAMIKADLQRIL